MTALYIALAVLLLIDWRQTLVIAEPGGWGEANPIARWFINHYGRTGVHINFVLAYLANAAGIYLLLLWREDAALVWAAVVASAELWATIHNYRNRIRI